MPLNVTGMILNIELPQRIIPYLAAALAFLVSLLSVYSIMQWHSDWVLAHQIPIIRSSLNASDETATLIAAIPDDHLFGTAFSSGEVPVTDLQLRVTGIVKIDQEQEGSASKVYISASGQPSKVYQVGDVLPYGVKVYEVTRDAVILENNGRLEKLPLPRERLQFKPRSIQEP